MLQLRNAQPHDAVALTDPAARSEAHWGYDADFMTSFREQYRITEEFIARNTVFVAEAEGRLLGFYALVPEEGGLALEYMYLDPASLGQGLGRILWDHMTRFCRDHRIPEIHLICGPQPKAFYLRMGAVEAGEADSLVVPGRKVSRLVYRIPAP